jgi:hypothetical protein
MKSAYEIAMEKLRKSSGPQKSLTEGQKQRIAEVDKRFEAKIAELRLGFDQRLGAAPAAERAAIEQQKVNELRRLEEKRESEKEAVWREAKS